MKTYSKSELFTLANKMRKEFNVSQKEAYAMAKAQLESNDSKSLHDELYCMMMTRKQS